MDLTLWAWTTNPFLVDFQQRYPRPSLSHTCATSSKNYTRWTWPIHSAKKKVKLLKAFPWKILGWFQVSTVSNQISWLLRVILRIHFEPFMVTKTLKEKIKQCSLTHEIINLPQLLHSDSPKLSYVFLRFVFFFCLLYWHVVMGYWYMLNKYKINHLARQIFCKFFIADKRFQLFLSSMQQEYM